MPREPNLPLRRQLADDPGEALVGAEALLRTDPTDAEAHRVVAQALRALGREGADAHELAAIDASAIDPELQEAALALLDQRLNVAEPILRGRLKRNPFDVAAIRMLAELAGRLGRNRDAEVLLRRAVELAPAFTAARANLATVLHRQSRTAEALEELDRLTVVDPENPALANLRAAVLGRVGEFDEAIALYEDVLAKSPEQPRIWMSYGHALKTVGRTADSVDAYRRAVELRPSYGEAWWSIANLKTAAFAETDIAVMTAALEDPKASDDDLLHLHFALGKAHADRGDPQASFDHYFEANRLRRDLLPYDADDTTKRVDAVIAAFTPALLSGLSGAGCPAADPIFVLGLPRAGSTLVEQILASHPLVEGTMELPDIPSLVERAENNGYPDDLASITPDQLARWGEVYLERTRIQRREDTPFFIDKLPNNWLHAGFIHLILPNARIVDARRHPLDCGYSNFRQHFARGQAFSYDLADIGRYYRDYVRLMAHFDRVLPGRIYRVIHERLLDAPEGEVRAMLDALGLPFDPACLAFHENTRAVRTASSEQVRRPINRDGEGAWRPVADRVGPRCEALGPVLDAYPNPA